MIIFDSHKCKGCGYCAAVCPNQVISFPEESTIPQVIQPGNCIDCWHCVAVCPHDALIHNRQPEKVTDEKSESNISANELDCFLASKRSIRRYKNIPVKKDIFNQLVVTAKYAPSSGNDQDRHFQIISEPLDIIELDKQIVDGYRKLRTILWFPALFSSKLKKLRKYFAKLIRKSDKGLFPVFHQAPHVVVIYSKKSNRMGVMDCAAAQDYFMLKAHALNLGTCVIGFAIFHHKILEKYLELEKDKRIHSVLTLGYPKYSYTKLIKRV